MPPDEWFAHAQGALALSPDFWEGPGANPAEAQVTALGAFNGERLLGYAAVREVPSGLLAPEMRTGLAELVARRRAARLLGAQAVAALERPALPDDHTAACSIGYVLAAERGRGVGTALMQAAIAFAGRDATPDQPMPVYLAVAPPNPARHLYARLGFEPLTVAGKPLTRNHPYYLPPTPEGTFAPPTEQDFVVMGTTTIA
jgi:GNAT superfamily N-acetyltransferase